MTTRARERVEAPDPRDAEKLREEFDRQREEEAKQAEREFQDWWRKARKGEKPRKHASPWLLIRYRLDDLGLRPTAPGDPYWRSPDIWVVSSDSAGQPVAGEPNIVLARIFNLGYFDASPTKVDFFWANPAVGLGPADMHLIGSVRNVEVPALQSVVVECPEPWVPDFVNNGHECLMVNCTNHVLDPIFNPFMPTLDRHVGQRNVHVVPAPAGSSLILTVIARNLLPYRAATRITGRIDHLFAGEVGRVLEPAELIEAALRTVAPVTNTAAELRARLRPGTAASRSAGAIVRLAERREELGLFEPVTLEGAAARGARLRVDVKERGAMAGEADKSWYAVQLQAQAVLSDQLFVKDDATILELNLLPGEEYILEVTLDMPTYEGGHELVVASIGHRTDELLLGGYTVVAPVEARS